MAQFFVRKGGSDNNAGTTASLTPERSGADMTTANGSTLVTSASAAFTAGDVGKGINVGGFLHKIASYVSATQVNLDRAAGTGTNTNRPWAIGGALLTVNKIVSLTSANTYVAAGDTIHVGAGVYRELLTLGVSWAGSQVKLRGDFDGTMTGDAGEVQISGYLTNDRTAPTTSALIAVTSPRSYWAFENIVFICGSARLAAWADSTNITFTNCAIIALYGTQSQLGTTHIFTTASAHNILYDSCRFLMGGSLSITLPTHASADYDANVVIKNCFMFTNSNNPISVVSSGALTFKGGGVYIYNSTLLASPISVSASGTSISTTYPVKVENCLMVSSGSVLSAGAVGQIVENYNVLIGANATPRSNVTAGANSVGNYAVAPLLSIGQESFRNGQIKPFLSPTPGSPLIAFGNSTSTGVPTVDALGAPRPGYQEFLVPVKPVASSVSVWMRFNGQTAKPQLLLAEGTQVGVADQTITMTAAADTWEQLTVNFTPTAKGVVTVRVVSRDTGTAYADDFEVEA